MTRREVSYCSCTETMSERLTASIRFCSSAVLGLSVGAGAAMTFSNLTTELSKHPLNLSALAALSFGDESASAEVSFGLGGSTAPQKRRRNSCEVAQTCVREVRVCLGMPLCEEPSRAERSAF